MTADFALLQQPIKFKILSLAMKWLMHENEPDLYDGRMRDWYIKAAASPKEIVILLDSSGKLERLDGKKMFLVCFAMQFVPSYVGMLAWIFGQFVLSFGKCFFLIMVYGGPQWVCEHILKG